MASKTKAISLKGINDGICLTIEEGFSFDDIKSELESILEKQKPFLTKTTLLIDSSKNSGITKENLEEIYSILDKYEIRYKQITPEKEIKKEKKIQNTTHETIRKPEIKNHILVQKTLRSGQTAFFDGSVILLGDVNDGAEVQAEDSVYVFGEIRGSVYAKNFIIAKKFLSAKIVIDDKVFIPENYENAESEEMKMLSIKNGELTLEAINKKF